MNKAELVLIHFDPNTFLTSAVQKAMSLGMEESENINLKAPYPIIKDQSTGHYSLVFSFADENENLRLRLLNEKGEQVKDRKIPIVPMFSGMVDSMDMMQAQDPMDFITGAGNFKEELEGFFTSSEESLRTANEEVAIQQKNFTEILSEWVELSGQSQILMANVFGIIVENATPLISIKRSRQFSGNFGPPPPRKN